MKFQPPKQQPMLVTLASADDLKSEKMVLDPNALDSQGHDRDRLVCAVARWQQCRHLNFAEAEAKTEHCIFTTAQRARRCRDTIAHVQYPTAGGSAAWNADGTGVYYTRFPRKGERPDADLNFYQQVYFHKLGTPDSRGHLLDRQRISANRRDRARNFARWQICRRDGGEWRRRRVRPLSARPGWQLEADHAIQRSGKAGAARPRQRALSAFATRTRRAEKILRMPLETPELAKATRLFRRAKQSFEANRADGERALCRGFVRRPVPDPPFRPGRQRANDSFRFQKFPPCRKCSRWKMVRCFSRRQLHRAGGLVSIRAPENRTGEDSAGQHLAGFVCRHRSDARIRAFEGRHKDSAQHHSPERNEARRAKIRRCFTATAATASACRRVSISPAGFGSIAAAFMSWPIFAAAASSAKNGTRPAT